MTAAPSEGYSLIELVIALLLLSMVALAAQSGLHFGVTVWGRTKEVISTTDQIDAAQNVLRAVLSHALPRQKGEYVTFSGGPDLLVFDAMPPNAFERYGTGRVKLSVVRGKSGQDLQITMTALNGHMEHRAVLADGLSNLRFEYLDASDRSATWLSSWQGKTHLPVAVRITSTDPIRWPAMVIRLAIAQTATCLLDLETMTCRLK